MPALSRYDARVDLGRESAEIRILKPLDADLPALRSRGREPWFIAMPRIFFVTRGLDDRDVACAAEKWLVGMWSFDSVARKTQNGLLPDWDAIGPDVIRDYHDYPGEDLFYSLIENLEN